MKKIIATTFASFISVSAFAWDGTKTGTISSVDVVPTSGENYGFRVVLSGSPEMCGNDVTWAYINKSDDNYDAAVSVLLAAKMAGNTGTIYSNKGANNYCHIGYVTLK